MEFDINRLSTNEQSEYLSLDPADQATYRDLWIAKQQEENRAKMENQRLKAAARKARAHRLIVRGAILENVIPELADEDNEAYEQFLLRARTIPSMQRYLEMLTNHSA